MSLGSSRGIALLSVLWITGLLAVIAASFASSTRTEARLARNQIDNAKAEALADGGVHRAVLGLLELDPEQAWQADRTVRRDAPWARAWCRSRSRTRTARSTSTPRRSPLLAGLFGVLGLAPSEAQAMAERIVDYRDPDDEPEPQGAEDPDYLAAGLAAGAADRELVGAGELLSVLGMTRELYERMRPTSRSIPAPRASTRRARRAPVLEALPGMTPRADRAAAERRRRTSTRSSTSRTRSLLERARDLLPADARRRLHDPRARRAPTTAAPSCARR